MVYLIPMTRRELVPIHLLPCRWVNRQRAFSQVLTKQGKIVVEGVNVKVRSDRVLQYLSLRGTLLHLQTLALPVGCFSRLKFGNLSCCVPVLQSKTVQPKPGTEEKGQIVQTESPVHHSNVMHWSKEQKVRSRIKHQCALF